MASRETLQKVLNANYDLTFFRQNVLEPVFGSSLTIYRVPKHEPINPSEEKAVKNIKQYGEVKLTDYRQLYLYEVALAENVIVERNKVSIGAVVKRLIAGNNAVLVNFYYPHQAGKSWRLSYIAKDQVIDDGEIRRTETHPKRYTYVLGPKESCRTAADRFAKLSLDTYFTADMFKEAFSVEKLSEKFFEDYKYVHYSGFIQHITGERIVRKDKKDVFEKVQDPSNLFKVVFLKGKSEDNAKKDVRDFVKKLLGRIVFLSFVQKKGWLGASDEQWADGDANFLQNLFLVSGKNENFYYLWLRKLFYDTLNNPNRSGNGFKMPDSKTVKIPYLNGGLFEDDDPNGILIFPSKLFANLFEFFNQYNFTIYEDSPDDHTVAVDPEMLGHIFENMLEDNKDKGAFYTPKEIVHYMCQESLIEYLATKLSITETASFQPLGKDQTEIFGNDNKKGQLALTQEHKTKSTDIARDDVEQFIKDKLLTDKIKLHYKDINKYLDELKICDPAIGSGAFPMGLLHEIFDAKQLLHQHCQSDEVFNAAEVKQNIIQNSIYGVDIEKGAVDIARLRFWLSLIVDEDLPRPLPNLDYKIVVGDSLLPKFEDEVVDIDWDTRVDFGGTQPLINIIQKGLQEIVKKQKQYFKAPEKDKLVFKGEIRNLKIDLLINQLMLDKIKYSNKHTTTGHLFEKTKKDKVIELEIQFRLKGFDNTIKKLEQLKKQPDKPLQFFDWKLDFPEIMNPAIAGEKVGFDIVIANPPYVGQKGHKDLFTPFSISSKWKTFYERKQDLYYYFIVTAIDLLNFDGIITYITPPYFTTAFAGRNLRKYISQKSRIQKILNLSEHLKVFDDVSINNLILFLDKKDKSRKIRIFEPKLNKNISHENVFQNLIIIESNYSTCEIGEEAWNLFKTKKDIEINPNVNDILLLGSIANISPGIQTGCDKLSESHIKKLNLINYEKGEGIFVISDKEKQHIKFTSEELKYIKPFYKNSAISKYIFNKKNKKWIIITNTIDKIDKYPNIKNHLLRYKKVLDARFRNFALKNADRDGKWWYLYGYRPNTNFEGVKIINPNRSNENRFAFSNEPFYSVMDVFFINVTNLNYDVKYILCILNSKFILYWLLKNGKKKGKMLELITEPLSQIPIKKAEYKSQLSFINIVDKILFTKKQGKSTSELEQQIDLMVYKLYGLTYDEVLVVDKDFEKQMSREEYEKLDYGFEHIKKG